MKDFVLEVSWKQIKKPIIFSPKVTHRLKSEFLTKLSNSSTVVEPTSGTLS
jgi:hypothetical protein